MGKAAFCLVADRGHIPLPSRDNQKPCLSGSYAQVGDSDCTPCADGAWSGEGEGSCTSCVTGKFGDSGIPRTSEAHCVVCAQGDYTKLVGVTTCQRCLPGTRGVAVPDGTSSADAALLFRSSVTSACVDCDAGKYTEEEGAARCDICQPITPTGSITIALAHIDCFGSYRAHLSSNTFYVKLSTTQAWTGRPPRAARSVRLV